MALASGIVPAQAAPGARASVEGCSNKTDNRSPNNWTAADWKICVGNYGGPHGEVDTKCYAGQTIGWNANPCTVSGSFEIRKGQEVVKSGRFAVGSPMNGIVTAVPFRFSCQGHGVYTFKTTGVHATLRDGNGNPRQGYESAAVADATAAVTMC
ncbi:hypothetical protein GCM10010347_43440 [Streptomyces cirratus]|uniref:Uncharacterized protein n=1 Tax=Streptomyces cirratus TaxID=68187 RepID=A0ABQ3F0Y4_9ACTN|nr:hypothetical protein GCM10010347_43440 [Streptomyces cirratus]